MEAKVIITRTAVKKGSMISTGRIYNGKSLTKLSTDILTSVKISYRCDDFIVYNATDKNGDKYNIIELKCRAVVTTQKIKKTNDEITGIGFDPIKFPLIFKSFKSFSLISTFSLTFSYATSLCAFKFIAILFSPF